MSENLLGGGSNFFGVPRGLNVLKRFPRGSNVLKSEKSRFFAKNQGKIDFFFLRKLIIFAKFSPAAQLGSL